MGLREEMRMKRAGTISDAGSAPWKSKHSHIWPPVQTEASLKRNLKLILPSASAVSTPALAQRGIPA
jgi:hypothetical protein